ncbi:hypothetical protein ACGL13_26330, partial [Enterobacter hormaechei]
NGFLLFFSAVDTMPRKCPCEGDSLWLVFTPASVGNKILLIGRSIGMRQIRKEQVDYVRSSFSYFPYCSHRSRSADYATAR